MNNKLAKILMAIPHHVDEPVGQGATRKKSARMERGFQKDVSVTVGVRWFPF
jgi:hypothetical protein